MHASETTNTSCYFSNSPARNTTIHNLQISVPDEHLRHFSGFQCSDWTARPVCESENGHSLSATVNRETRPTCIKSLCAIHRVDRYLLFWIWIRDVEQRPLHRTMMPDLSGTSADQYHCRTEKIFPILLSQAAYIFHNIVNWSILFLYQTRFNVQY